MQRCLLPSCCRASNTFYVAEHDRKVKFMMEKPCRPSFLCFKRPTLKINVLDRELDADKMSAEEKKVFDEIKAKTEKDGYKIVNSSYIGKVEMPLNLFSHEVIIYNAEGDPLYRISGSNF